MNQDNKKERKIQTSQQYAMTPATQTQTYPQYSIHVTNQFQTLPSEDFPPLTYAQASIKPPTQTSSFDSSKYFTKPIRYPIAYTKYREPQSLLELNKFFKVTFLPDCYHIPDSPFKTRQFYELILVVSKSVEIEHIPDKHTPNFIAYSKCRMLKVLTGKDWPTTYATKSFSVPFNPPGYHYIDYQNAWYETFLYRPFNHSWFMSFDTRPDITFPLWFYEWWTVYGSLQII